MNILFFKSSPHILFFYNVTGKVRQVNGKTFPNHIKSTNRNDAAMAREQFSDMLYWYAAFSALGSGMSTYTIVERFTIKQMVGDSRRGVFRLSGGTY